jgi:prepilin-type N-terminal cleavage/methylation domain-containing protein/prepilin-type processing-associated H-X9-DG protein
MEIVVRHHPAPSRDRGFTLVELLVVIGIIALLIAILMPALQRAREQAVRISCLSQQRQVYLAAMMYVNNSNGWFLPASQMSGELTGEQVGRLNLNGELGLLKKLGYLPGKDAPDRATPGSYCPAATVYSGGEYEGYAFRRNGGISVTVDGKTLRFVRWTKFHKATTGDNVTQPRAIIWCPNYPDPAAYSFAAWTSWTNVHDGKGINVTYADGSGHWVSSFSGLDYNGKAWSSSKPLGVANQTNPTGSRAKIHVDRNY